MANLSGQNIGTNYKGILNLNTLNGNLTTTLQAVTDGDGNASPLRLSTTAANIATPFTVGTMSGSVWNVVFDMTSGTNPGGYLHWKLANDATNYFSMYQQGGKMQFFNPGGGYGQGIVFSTNGINRLEISSGGLLQLGGTTNAFPAIKRNGAAIDFRLADDSAYARIDALSISLNGGGAPRGSGWFISGNGAGFEVTSFSTRLVGNALIFYDATTAGVLQGHFDTKAYGFGASSLTSPTGVNNSVAFYVDSTTRGFLPPRMTTAQRDLIGTPAAGLMIYNTSTNRPNFYDGSAWVAL